MLAVRDLASGQQLLWQPVVTEATAEVLRELTMLVTLHGAPLVLKMDNGSAFIAEALHRFLAVWQVQPLYSPPRMPTYNGSIEAANGSLKTRTQQQAEQAGHPGTWSVADAAAARAEANTARPRRLQGRTPAQVWAARPPLPTSLRLAFGATVARCQAEARREQALPPDTALSRVAQAKVDRQAVPRALVAHALLLFRRRRIPPPIKRQRAASNR